MVSLSYFGIHYPSSMTKQNFFYRPTVLFLIGSDKGKQRYFEVWLEIIFFSKTEKKIKFPVLLNKNMVSFCSFFFSNVQKIIKLGNWDV